MIHELKTGKKRFLACLAGRGPGQRRRFATREEAASWMQLKAIEAANAAPPALNPRRELDAREALAMLPAGVSLCDAARHYAATMCASRVTMQEAWNEYYSEREKSGLRPESLCRLRVNVKNHLCGKIPALAVSEVTTGILGPLLPPPSAAPWTRNTRRACWATFFAWCIRRGYCRANPALDLPIVLMDQAEIGIFTPDKAQAWLSHVAAHRPDMLPFFALGFFAGIRTSEIFGLRWADVMEDVIRVRPAVAKMRRQRLVPILPALRACLPADQPPGDASIAPASYRATWYWHRLACRKLVLKWPHNGMRHSYISYRVAHTRDAAQVALECGNSVNMIFAHYRELVTEQQAQRYFAIRVPQNVTPI